MTQEASKMEVFNELVKARPDLPALSINQLMPMAFIGQAAMSLYRAKIQAMDDLGTMEDQRKATLADAQDAGELLLDIEVELGRRYNEAKPEPGDRRQIRDGTVPNPQTDKQSLKERFGEKRIKEAAILHKHTDAVEQVKKEAKARQDIPSRTAVIKHVQAERLKKDLKAERTKPEEQRLADQIRTATATMSDASTTLDIAHQIAQRIGVTEFSGVDAMKFVTEVRRLERSISRIKPYVGLGG